MQFRQSGGKYIKRLKVFSQILKTVLMKKFLSWEEASWKTPQNAVFTIAPKIFREDLKPSRSNSDTSIANTQTCRHFFCYNLVIVSLNKKKEILKFSQIRPFFAQYPKWTFLKLSILSHCFLGDVECSLRTFLRVFAQIPKLVMSLDYIPKKRKWYSGKTECSSKKMEVTLSRIK